MGLTLGVEEDTHVQITGVDTLHESVKDRLEIIQVAALTTCWASIGITLGHSVEPAIVHAHAECEVSTDGIDGAGEVPSANTNVGSGVEAVSIAGAFLASELHETPFAIGSSGIGVAARFLESDGGQHDGGNTRLAGHVIEAAQKVAARCENVVGVIYHRAEVDIFDILARDGRWRPATRANIASEPFYSNIRVLYMEDVIFTYLQNHWDHHCSWEKL